MNTEVQEVKPKLSRGELLAKARQAKAEKARARELAEKVKELEVMEPVRKLPEPVPNPIPAPVPLKRQKSAKKVSKVEVKELEVNKKVAEPEVINEVVRIPANRRKKIVKRTIEIEESETDEEVVEEIVKIPKIKKEVKLSHQEMKKKLIEVNKQRLHNELFS